MPTKGRPQIGTRVSEEVYAELLDQIELSNLYRREEPWTIATFVEQAIVEKLAKMKRSRKMKEQRYPRRDEGEEG